MDHIPCEVLANIFSHIPTSDRLPVSFTCRRWLTILSKNYPNIFEIRINFDSSSCTAKLESFKSNETHITICSCNKHLKEHSILLSYLFDYYADGIRSLSFHNDLIIRNKQDIEYALNDMTFHNVLKKTPATIQQFSLNDIDLTKVQTWTLALIAKFDALQQIALNSCRFPLNKESFICRLLAPSFHSLNAIAITDTDQISDKFVAIISKRCPMLSDINVSGCKHITALSLVALCESANFRRYDMVSINLSSTSFDYKLLERYLCSPLLLGGNNWIATPGSVEIGFKRSAIFIENTQSRNLLIIAYV